MSTHNVLFSIQKRKSPYIILNLILWDFCKGLKNSFEIAVVNESTVFEPLKFYCSSSQYSSLTYVLFSNNSAELQQNTGRGLIIAFIVRFFLLGFGYLYIN